MLEVFFLISTIALLFGSWTLFFVLQALFWFGYGSDIDVSNKKGFKIRRLHYS